MTSVPREATPLTIRYVHAQRTRHERLSNVLRMNRHVRQVDCSRSKLYLVISTFKALSLSNYLYTYSVDNRRSTIKDFAQTANLHSLYVILEPM